MEAQQVNTQSQSTEPNAYPDRDTGDMEEVVEELEEGSPEENEVVGEFIDRIDGEIRDEVGATNHFEAPIRSLNHPENTTITTEDGRTLQVAGEEFGQLNNVLSEYADIGNIQYWVAANPGTYGEEDWNDGGEHIVGGESEDVQAYAVRIDGEFRTAEEIDEIMEDMNIRQANNLFGGMEVPELMVEYGNVSEAVENEEITEEQFHDQYRKARQTGLVSENGNLTLKGLLRAVDLEAQDLDSLEQLGPESDTAVFRSLSHENFPYLEQDDIVGHDGTVTVDPGPRNMDEDSTEGRIARGQPEGALAEQLGLLEEVLGHSIEDYSSEQEDTYTMSLAEYTREIIGEDVPGQPGLDQLDEVEAAQLATTVANLEEAGVTQVSTAEALSLEDPRRHEMENGYESLDEWSDVLGFTEAELQEEMNENTEFIVGEEGVETRYTGDRDDMKPLIEGFATDFSGRRIDDEEPVGRFRDNTRIGDIYLQLLPHRDELEEKVSFDDERGSVYLNSIRRYDELSEEAKDTLDELEQQDLIETDVSFNDYTGSVEIDAQDPMRYREAVNELQELEGLEFEQSSTSTRKRTKIDLENVKTRVTSNLEDEEEMREELEGFLDELRDHNVAPLISKTEEVKDYDKIGNNDLKHHVNEILDVIDSKYLKKAARTVVDEPEMVEDERLRKRYSEMNGLLDEYDVGERNERPSDELLEKLEDLYDRGIIDAEREIRDNHSDYEKEFWDYSDPSEELNFENFDEMSEEQVQRLEQLEEEGLIKFDRPNKEMEIESNYGEQQHIPLRAEGRYRVEEVDMEEGEMEVDVSYEPGDDFVYEAKDELRTMAEHLDPVEMEQQPFGQVEMETSFEYEAA